jgi:hypothetical protein
MTAPDFLPILAKGAHDDPKYGACVMEYCSILAGEEFSDKPSCTNPVLSEMARVVNDKLSNANRQKILPLIPRLMNSSSSHGVEKLDIRLAVWCARQVLPLVWEQNRAVCESAITTTEAYLVGSATKEDCRTAAYDVYAANAADAAYATTTVYDADAVYAVANAANAAYATKAAANAAAAARAAYAARAAAYAAANDDGQDSLIALLAGLIDEYDRLTGRVETGKLSDYELSQLAEATR